jgi:hypothetical protein
MVEKECTVFINSWVALFNRDSGWGRLAIEFTFGISTENNDVVIYVVKALVIYLNGILIIS